MSYDKTNDNLVSTVALVLEAFINNLQSKMPHITVVYDEYLSFDTSLRLLRDNNNLRDGFTNKLPLFIFKRSVLRPQEEGMGRRSVTQRVINKISSTEADLYRVIFAVFDIEFMFLATKMSELESFELSWLTEYDIASEKEIKISIPGLGEFPYYMRFNALDDKVINSQSNYYKSLNGTLSVRGNYLVFLPNKDTENGKYKCINEVRKRILNFYNSILEQELIKG